MLALAWEQLRTCYDPEIPINIVDLGLIYECTVSAQTDGQRAFNVRLTLTAPGCGMGDVLVQDIKQKTGNHPDGRGGECRAGVRPAVEPVDDDRGGAAADRADVEAQKKKEPHGMKTLTIVRHAKSSWDDETLGDRERPLNERGERDAPMMGRRIAAAGIRPSLIIASPAVRTWSTARAVAEELNYPLEFLQRENELYLASLRDILDVVGATGSQVQQPAARRTQSRHDGVRKLPGRASHEICPPQA